MFKLTRLLDGLEMKRGLVRRLSPHYLQQKASQKLAGFSVFDPSSVYGYHKRVELTQLPREVEVCWDPKSACEWLASTKTGKELYERSMQIQPEIQISPLFPSHKNLREFQDIEAFDEHFGFSFGAPISVVLISHKLNTHSAAVVLAHELEHQLHSWEVHNGRTWLLRTRHSEELARVRHRQVLNEMLSQGIGLDYFEPKLIRATFG